METEVLIVRRPIIETEIEECPCDACTGRMGVDGIQQRHLLPRFDIYRQARLGVATAASSERLRRAARQLVGKGGR